MHAQRHIGVVGLFAASRFARITQQRVGARHRGALSIRQFFTTMYTIQVITSLYKFKTSAEKRNHGTFQPHPQSRSGHRRHGHVNWHTHGLFGRPNVVIRAIWRKQQHISRERSHQTWRIARPVHRQGERQVLYLRLASRMAQKR